MEGPRRGPSSRRRRRSRRPQRAHLEASSLQLFRSYYPRGANYLVTPQTEPPYLRRFGKLEVTVCNPEGIAGRSL